MEIVLDCRSRWYRKAALLLTILVAAAVTNVAYAQQSSSSATPAAKVEQLVAPIALYPDDLLSQLLMAATYPLEVVEAARWSKDNPATKGSQLEEALRKQPWDPSVKSLVAVPQTLQMMSDKIAWTQELGDVFLAQQQDVLDAVQRLRARADAEGNLKSSKEQKVTRTKAGAQGSSDPAGPIYVIEPAVADTYYVPIYDPETVYGEWPYADYWPFYWYPSGYGLRGAVGFAAGIAAGAAIWGNIDWRRNRVDIDVNRYNNFNRTQITDKTWVHNPSHRRGVDYKNPAVAAKFSDQDRAIKRDAIKGKTGSQPKTSAGKQGPKPKTVSKASAPKGAAKGKSAATRSKAAKKSTASRKPTGSKQPAKKVRSAGHRPAAKPVSRPRQANRSGLTRAHSPNVRRAPASRGGGHRGGRRR